MTPLMRVSLLNGDFIHRGPAFGGVVDTEHFVALAEGVTVVGALMHDVDGFPGVETNRVCDQARIRLFISP